MIAWDELYQSNNTGITFNAPIEVQDALIHKIQSLKKSTIFLLIIFFNYRGYLNHQNENQMKFQQFDDNYFGSSTAKQFHAKKSVLHN